MKKKQLNQEKSVELLMKENADLIKKIKIPKKNKYFVDEFPHILDMGEL